MSFIVFCFIMNKWKSIFTIQMYQTKDASLERLTHWIGSLFKYGKLFKLLFFASSKGRKIFHSKQMLSLIKPNIIIVTKWKSLLNNKIMVERRKVQMKMKMEMQINSWTGNREMSENHKIGRKKMIRILNHFKLIHKLHDVKSNFYMIINLPVVSILSSKSKSGGIENWWKR